MKKLLYIVLVGLLFSCETTINPDLKEAEEILVIDAFLQNKMEPQVIKVTRSQPYFEDEFPGKVDNAIVFVEDLISGERFDFIENEEGYVWNPASTPFGQVGSIYRLSVTADGETFEAYSDMGRVPPVDSIKFTFNEKDQFVPEDYYTAEFVATDFPGEGDTYWIKTWKNGVYLSKPIEINVAYDAGFSAGGAIDGQVFIQPIQDEVNPFDEIPDSNNEFFPPYLPEDSIYVEIHSINIMAFNWLTEVAIQTDRQGGFAELFAQPLANVSTNFTSTDPNSATNVAGFFNVAGVTSRGAVLTQEIADLAQQVAERE